MQNAGYAAWDWLLSVSNTSQADWISSVCEAEGGCSYALHPTMLLEARHPRHVHSTKTWWQYPLKADNGNLLLKAMVLTGCKTYSGSGLSNADDPGSRAWCLDLSIHQCMSDFAWGGSKYPCLQGLEVMDCFVYMCCPKHTAEFASIQSALGLKVPAFSH